MLEIPSIIRIIEEIDLLKLSDLEPQGYKVRDSNFFMVDFSKFSHILLSCTYICTFWQQFIKLQTLKDGHIMSRPEILFEVTEITKI